MIIIVCRRGASYLQPEYVRGGQNEDVLAIEWTSSHAQNPARRPGECKVGRLQPNRRAAEEIEQSHLSASEGGQRIDIPDPTESTPTIRHVQGGKLACCHTIVYRSTTVKHRPAKVSFSSTPVDVPNSPSASLVDDPDLVLIP